MLCIQDPSYENSKYLHETLLSECVDCTVGAGAYAFATKDGINLLLSDENFKKFLERGTYPSLEAKLLGEMTEILDGYGL